jgi:hypothetical protein
MTQITHTVTINRAPEAVWTYISDLSALSHSPRRHPPDTPARK